MPDVEQIVSDWLRQHGYDGLYARDGECACEVGDLAPCGEMRGDCSAGYKVMGCSDDCAAGGGCRWHIVEVTAALEKG